MAETKTAKPKTEKVFFKVNDTTHININWVCTWSTRDTFSQENRVRVTLINGSSFSIYERDSAENYNALLKALEAKTN